MERLLRAHAASEFDKFLEWDDGCSLAEPSSAAFLGKQIGPYRIVQRIAAGAMGIVYRGRRTEGYQQEVAIKVLRPWLCDRESIARFRAEQQALVAIAQDH